MQQPEISIHPLIGRLRISCRLNAEKDKNKPLLRAAVLLISTDYGAFTFYKFNELVLKNY